MLKAPDSVRRVRRQLRTEQGYILLTLLLFVSLLSIALLVELPILKHQISRDQEEEMVHRGVEYSRAVRRYFRKFGRYPANLDVLENVNQMRFLRRRYKDPITGGDFRILRVTDVQLGFGAGLGGGRNLGKSLNSAFNPGGDSTGATTDPNAPNATSNPPPPDTSASPTSSAPTTAQTGSDTSSSTSPSTNQSDQPAGKSFGGVPIVGVASESTKQSIRIYNSKNHYNEWQFIYDPTQDRGLLITGPYQPALQAMLPGQNGPLNGIGVSPGTGQTQNAPGTVQPNAPSPTPNPMQH
jgi:type II secretory pathway pseudopilin PulG